MRGHFSLAAFKILCLCLPFNRLCFIYVWLSLRVSYLELIELLGCISKCFSLNLGSVSHISSDTLSNFTLFSPGLHSECMSIYVNVHWVSEALFTFLPFLFYSSDWIIIAVVLPLNAMVLSSTYSILPMSPSREF